MEKLYESITHRRFGNYEKISHFNKLNLDNKRNACSEETCHLSNEFINNGVFLSKALAPFSLPKLLLNDIIGIIMPNSPRGLQQTNYP